MSFLEEGSGGSLSQENLDGSDGTTIPKLTLNLDEKKRISYDEEKKNVPTEKYPDVDEGKEDGQDDEASGDEDASTKAGPNESEEKEKGDGTAASSYHEPEPEPEPDLSSIKPDQGYSEIGVWDNKVGEGGSETVRENELDNVMEKLKEVYHMIGNVIKKWDNSDDTIVEPLFHQKFVEPSGEEERETDSVNEDEGNTSTEVTTQVGNEKEPLSYTSPAPTEYNTNTDEATTEKEKRRRRQKKKRRHRRIRRIRRRQ